MIGTFSPFLSRVLFYFGLECTKIVTFPPFWWTAYVLTISSLFFTISSCAFAISILTIPLPSVLPFFTIPFCAFSIPRPEVPTYASFALLSQVGSISLSVNAIIWSGFTWNRLEDCHFVPLPLGFGHISTIFSWKWLPSWLCSTPNEPIRLTVYGKDGFFQAKEVRSRSNQKLLWEFQWAHFLKHGLRLQLSPWLFYWPFHHF